MIQRLQMFALHARRHVNNWHVVVGKFRDLPQCAATFIEDLSHRRINIAVRAFWQLADDGGGQL
jgi:hypothetical protein